MMVGVEADANVYTKGTVSLPEFTSTNQETVTIDITNGGGTPFAYTLTADRGITLYSTYGASDTSEKDFVVGNTFRADSPRPYPGITFHCASFFPALASA